MPTTICQNRNCQKEFYYKPKGKGRTRRFCSTNCTYPNSYLIEVESNCPICGDLFLKVDSNNKNNRRLTCGKRHCQKSRKNHPNYSHKIEVQCNYCKTLFLKTSARFYEHMIMGHKRHFCSTTCLKACQSAEFLAKRIAGLESRGVDPNKFEICGYCDTAKPIEQFTRSNRIKKRCKQCLYDYQKQRWHEKKIRAIEYLGGHCVDCGYNKHIAALDFHHRNPEEKEFEWHKLKLRSNEAIIKELNKCDLLCANCHRIRHAIHTMAVL